MMVLDADIPLRVQFPGVPGEHARNTFSTINDLRSASSSSSVPRHLQGANGSSQRPFRNPVNKLRIDTTLDNLVAELKLPDAVQIKLEVQSMVADFITALVKQRQALAAKKLEAEAKLDLAIRTACGVCSQPPETGQQQHPCRSEFCVHGFCRLCSGCKAEEDETVRWLDPRPADPEALGKWREYIYSRLWHNHSPDQIARNKVRRMAASSSSLSPPAVHAFDSITAAAVFLVAEAHRWRLRWSELGAALKDPLRKETLKKWVAKIRDALGLQAPSTQDRLLGYIRRHMRACHISEDSVLEEDLEVMVQGLVRASQKQPRADGGGGSVADVDGRLQMCILRGRLGFQPPRKRAKTESHSNRELIKGHSDRMIAAVLLYLRLRLSSSQSLTVQDIARCVGVDLQSFQACKACVILYIDSDLWE